MLWLGVLLFMLSVAAICGILAVHNLAKARHWDMHR